MLALRIDFLNGVYHAADPSAHERPEWPPHPDRLFQALVAAAYRAGLDPAPLIALEGQCPDLDFGETSGAVESATHYVPAAYKANQSRVAKFDPMVVGITDPVYVVWPQGPDGLREPLARIAAEIDYLGRAKTPVAVTLADTLPSLPYHLRQTARGEHLLRVPQPGRLAELDAAFAAGRRAPVAAMVGYTDSREPAAPSPWSELLTLRPQGTIDIRRAPDLAGALRLAVLSHAGDSASPLLHGHAGDHAAWTVIPDVGHRHARGHVLGLGLWLPAGLADQVRTQCVLPLTRVNHIRLGERRIELGPPAAHQPLPRGLQRHTWTRRARVWTSVTPVVFDRHPKRGRSAEEAIADSVELAGHPRPSRVVLNQTGMLAGVPVARAFRSRRPGRWTHVTLSFESWVAGPLLIGRDRHFGLGLMRPLAGEDVAL